MNNFAKYSLLLATALCSGAAFAQEIAGRVLVAAGQVTIQRGAEKFPAQRGTEVRTGDTFLVGEKSNAQIRLTDESIIALSSKTTFRLSQYAFVKAEPKKQSAFFDLLAGGIRTVTGIIGRADRDAYRVTTPTATVGIRGTHYALRYCNNDCYEGGSASAGAEPIKVASADAARLGPLAQAGGPGSGALAPNGTYGAVTDGRIGVTNQAGESVFGADQYFFVASISSPAQQLIAPPIFLRDTLEGRAAARAAKPAAAAQPGAQAAATSSTGGESASTVAQTGLGGGTGDIGVAAATSTTTAVSVQDINAFTATEAAVTEGSIGEVPPPSAPPPAPPAPSTGTKYYRVEGSFPVTLQDFGQVLTQTVNGDATLGVNYDRGLATFSVNVSDPVSPSDKVNFGTFGPITVTQSGGVATLSGQVEVRLRCTLDCPPGGELVLLNVSGTISGTTATLVLTYADPLDPDYGGVFGSVTMTEAAAPNNAVGAISIPRAAGGSDRRSAALWAVDVDGAGRLLRLGPTVGQPMADAGSAQILTNGSEGSSGVIWGLWVGPGQSFVDTNYQSVVPTISGPNSQVQPQPWITGQIPSVIPSTGTVTYSPVGAEVLWGYGKLNSASLSIDFVNLVASVDINATKWAGSQAGNTFQMNGSSQVSPVTTRFQNSFTSVTCTGGPCNGGATPGGSFAGFLSGSNAQGAGLVFGAGWSGVAGGLTGAIALAQGAGPMTPDAQFNGVKFYSIQGPISLPAVLNGSPTSVTMKIATIRVDYRNGIESSWDLIGARVLLENGGELAFSSNLGPRWPATIQGRNVNLALSTGNSIGGACQSCGPGGTIGNLQFGTAFASVTGGTATLVFTGQDGAGNTRSFTTSLGEIAPLTKWGGIAVPNATNGNVLTRAFMTPDSNIDGSGRLLALSGGGTPLEGRGSAYVGTATNTIVGSDASAGNLVWGTWTGGGAELIGSDFVKYTTPATGPDSVQPWITGTLPTTFPNSTSVTYSPVGYVINGGNATLDSAGLTANFVNRSMGFGVTFTRTGGELNTWSFSGGSGVDGAGKFGAGIATANISCTGGPCTGAASATGGFQGHFSGPNAEGAGLVFSVGSGIANGGTGAVAFKR